MARIKGKNSSERLNGTSGSDVILGLGGNDVINGRAGADRIDGGTGNDTIRGVAGNDVLRGGTGNDMLLGGVGNDRFFGGAGNDRIVGQAGIDTAFFTGSSDQYIFANSASTFSVGHAGGSKADGTDTVSRTVEFVSFTDTGAISVTKSGPFARADNVSVGEDSKVSGNVLTNDFDLQNKLGLETLTVTNVDGKSIGSAITLASGAKVTMNANGTFSYDPGTAFDDLDFGQSVMDQFTYAVSDGNGGTSQSTVFVTVNGNDDGSGVPPVININITEVTNILETLGDVITNVVNDLTNILQIFGGDELTTLLNTVVNAIDNVLTNLLGNDGPLDLTLIDNLLPGLLDSDGGFNVPLLDGILDLLTNPTGFVDLSDLGGLLSDITGNSDLLNLTNIEDLLEGLGLGIGDEGGILDLPLLGQVTGLLGTDLSSILGGTGFPDLGGLLDLTDGILVLPEGLLDGLQLSEAVDVSGGVIPTLLNQLIPDII